MPPKCFCRFSIVIWLASEFLVARSGIAKDPISFDAPAVICASPVYDHNETPIRPGLSLYEICVPISTLVQTRGTLPEYQVWCFIKVRSAPWKVIEFQPRTELTSHFLGPVQIDRQQETSQRIGVNLTGRIDSWGNAAANSELSGKKKEHLIASQSPPMILLQASGTIERGTGVFFKFRPSDQTTLEGLRLLTFVVEVPDTWRVAMMRVHCLAEPIGDSKTSRSFGESVFPVVVYHGYDLAAEQAAKRLAVSERGFRNHWRRLEETPRRSFSQAAKELDLQGVIDSMRPRGVPPNCDHMVDRLIFSHRDRKVPRAIQLSTIAIQKAAAELQESDRAFRELATEIDP